jgi:sulfonate transport system substrate-binding protein
MTSVGLGFRALAVACAIGFSLIRAASAEEPREIRFGYMKGGVRVVAKARHVLEDRLAPRGITVKWIEFSVGPPMLEAMVAGRLDFGSTGNTPPIFAQSAGANLVYVATGGRHASGSGILVLKNSPIRTVAELKGKRVGICKGSGAQNLIIAALEQAGLSYDDIVPVYLSPSDTAAAFVSGQIDAWPTWDPFYTLAEKTAGARVLLDAESVTPTYGFFLANAATAKAHPELVREVEGVLAEVADWANSHPKEVVDLIAATTGLPVEVERAIIARSHFAVQPVSEDAIAAQQAVADRFLRLKLIPKSIQVRDAVWVPPGADTGPFVRQPALANTAPQGDARNESH